MTAPSPFILMTNNSLIVILIIPDSSSLLPTPPPPNTNCYANSSKKNANLGMVSVFPQYYEMSYGLNVEMHKQVSLPLLFTINIIIPPNYTLLYSAFPMKESPAI